MADLRIGPGTDWEQAVNDLAASNEERRARRGEKIYPGASRAFAIGRLDPALRAARRGHTVIWDPPAALTGGIERWTCIHCGDAVLNRPGYGLYGEALKADCTQHVTGGRRRG